MPARIAAVLLASLVYLLVSHWLMTRDPLSPWNAVVLITPMIAAAAFGTWRAGQRARSLGLQAVVAGLVYQASTDVRVPAPLLYLGQHVTVHAMLALWFASTLRDGAVPIISALAQKLHGHLTPGMRSYTRGVTRAWVVYFAAVAAASVSVFCAARFEAWAVFANLLTPASLVLMFVGESFVRYRLHPEFERASLIDGVRAYMEADKEPLATPLERRP